ncbi:tRNA 5-methoxyuridine(34)/uridine 5-oxyacetic acid(34) synthase CmoB, partial [Oleiphilus sp. HI0067]
WRKGPFELFNTHIDTEWRSDWKWDRVSPHISPLANKNVLDVGCGSGYHCWRMLGEGANRVIGIDPSYLFLMQFNAIKKYCGRDAPIHLLPIKMEDVHPQLEHFDTVFSMGVLYHRKSPIDHLYELKGALKPGGELVLETLVVEGELGYSLMPEDRYAMMRNVWYLPSVPTLELWLRRAGFTDIKCVDLDQTSLDEQRATEWMDFQSLADFLDPANPNLTVEGYPAPLRATLVA